VMRNLVVSFVSSIFSEFHATIYRIDQARFSTIGIRP